MNKGSRFSLKIYLMATLIFLVSGGLVVFAGSCVQKGMDFFTKPQFNQTEEVKEENIVETEQEQTGTVNFLLVGTDKEGLHTDTIMVATYDMDNNKVSILSIPRDTRVRIKGKYQKINAAHAIGGMDLLLETLKDSFGISINYYVDINYAGFDKVIDALGGIDFEVPRDMDYDDPVQNLHIHIKQGMQHLNGAQAEGVVRWRHNNNYTLGYTEGDVGRIGTQQAFMKTLIEEKLTAANLAKAPELYGIMSENFKTNMTIAQALSYVPNLKKLPSENVTTYQLPGTGQYVGKISYFLYNQQEAQTMLADTIGMEGISVKACYTGE